jgi:hypothetical protein
MFAIDAPTQIYPLESIERCDPGATISDPRPGDFILVRGVGWLGWLIRIFERMRYRTDQDRPFAYWSHAAIIVGPEGLLVEVLHKGVVLSKLEKYRGQEYHYIHLNLSEANRRNASRHACACLRQRYGASSFLMLAFSLLVGDRLRISDRGQQGCAALIVRALQCAGITFERGPAEMMPADLAKYFGVRPRASVAARRASR